MFNHVFAHKDTKFQWVQKNNQLPSLLRAVANNQKNEPLGSVAKQPQSKYNKIGKLKI